MLKSHLTGAESLFHRLRLLRSLNAAGETDTSAECRNDMPVTACKGVKLKSKAWIVISILHCH